MASHPDLVALLASAGAPPMLAQQLAAISGAENVPGDVGVTVHDPTANDPNAVSVGLFQVNSDNFPWLSDLLGTPVTAKGLQASAPLQAKCAIALATKTPGGLTNWSTWNAYLAQRAGKTLAGGEANAAQRIAQSLAKSTAIADAAASGAGGGGAGMAAAAALGLALLVPVLALVAHFTQHPAPAPATSSIGAPHPAHGGAAGGGHPPVHGVAGNRAPSSSASPGTPSRIGGVPHGIAPVALVQVAHHTVAPIAHHALAPIAAAHVPNANTKPQHDAKRAQPIATAVPTGTTRPSNSLVDEAAAVPGWVWIAWCIAALLAYLWWQRRSAMPATVTRRRSHGAPTPPPPPEDFPFLRPGQNPPRPRR